MERRQGLYVIRKSTWISVSYTHLITVTAIRINKVLASFDAVVKVDGNVYAKGSMTFTTVDRKDIYGTEE